MIEIVANKCFKAFGLFGSENLQIGQIPHRGLLASFFQRNISAVIKLIASLATTFGET